MKSCYLKKSKRILVWANRIVTAVTLPLLGAAAMLSLLLTNGILSELVYTRACQLHADGIRIGNFGRVHRFYP